ncbi:MAG: tRNA epoxyqueuosine(34) reductase QueG [Chloroflexota bacterium]
MESQPEALAARVKELALEAGFDLVGIASTEPFEREKQAMDERIGLGMFDGLAWFTRERASTSTNPRALLPDARSIICLAASYYTDGGPAGIIARYAWGEDYHRVLRRRMETFRQALEVEIGGFEWRCFVDTGRLVDRAAAVRAGIGWYGKNTNLLNSRFGSWVFLAELITTLALTPDEPTRQHCGQCHACIDACPTGAIRAPYVVDSDRCISFLTIELRGPIPRELRPAIGRYIFGCDICQDVCPVNAQAGAVTQTELAFNFRTRFGTVDELAALLDLDEDGFGERFRGSAIKRAKRRGLLRNICVALGNSGDRRAVRPLARALEDVEPLVRGHAAWGLGRLGGSGARTALMAAGTRETDRYVKEEIEFALTTR